MRVEQAVRAGAQPEHARRASAPPVIRRLRPGGACRPGRSRASPSPPRAAAIDRARPAAPGSTMLRSARRPVARPARSRRARRTRCTLSTSCGATLIETMTATPSSYSAPGSTRSARLGLARVLAAPTQQSRQASRSPSVAADSAASSETGRRSGCRRTNPASGSRGSRNRTWSAGVSRCSKTDRKTTRIAITVKRETQVVLERREPTARRCGGRPRRSPAPPGRAAAAAGCVVRLTAVASPSAQIHQATGCSVPGQPSRSPPVGHGYRSAAARPWSRQWLPVPRRGSPR